LHRWDEKSARIASARDVASRIKGAQFVELDGNDHWFFAGDQGPVLEAIKRFIDMLPREARAGRKVL
jgi:pimeloyl-ACP methyl ester carboxylesterase